MGIIIISILLLIVSAGIFIGASIFKKNCDDYDKNLAKGIFFCGFIPIIIMGVALAIASFTQVPTGNTGILTTFGKVENETLDSGLKWIKPWQKTIFMDNRTQKQQIQMSCFSSDIQEVTVVYTLNYQINKENAQEIYKTIGVDYYDIVILPKTQEAVKAVISKYNAEALIENRGKLSSQIEESLTTTLSNYNINVTATSIEDIDFTDAFTNAVEAKQVAEQNKLKAKTEQEQKIIEAEAAAKQQVLEAQGKADSDIIQANADAEIAKIGADAAEYQGIKDAAIMSNLGEMLSMYPNLIEYYKATGWNGELPDTMLSDSANLFINQ